MKIFLVLFLALFTIPFFSFSQPVKGNTELSFQGNYSSIKTTSDPSLGFYNPGENISQGMLFIRAGYFLTNQFSIDPELTWSFSSSASGTRSVALSLNGTFHMVVNTKFLLFGTAGAGLTDAIPNTWMFRDKIKLDILMLNFGLGLKYFVSEDIALRTEYRNQAYSYDEHFSYFGRKTKTTFKTSVNNFLLGFSIFL
ncbi:MAG: outer membrane beta-barrel protein [Bacteroidetes bacterium]|nr:outer membrane beta-barrel protein [Bacteroidota bacterium]